MRLPSWLQVSSTRSTIGTVTVTLTADTSAYVAGAREAASAIRYHRMVEHQWSLARAYLGVALDELARSVGLDPVQAWRLPRFQDERRAKLADLHHPDRAVRKAAEAAWLVEHRAHRAGVVAQREAGADA